MSATWTVVVLTGLATMAIKSLGPVLLGGKPLPPRATGVVALLAPALLAALVAINTVGGDQELVLDARLPGVLAAAVAIKLRAPVLVVVVIAALVTAGVRALTG
ncbi:MAG: AzlD domain-containing protein [Actinomycetota bacterium]